ncbi:hypothetical protein GS575_11995 [Rhodococcus hoagii]|nr:hypothetical protein [Prescottella equi]
MLRDLYDQGVLANQDSAGQMESFMKGDTAIQLQSSAIQGHAAGCVEGRRLGNCGPRHASLRRS